ncbi:hypothetical protein [Winogradskyella aurantia]|uniref:Uncharacterized protein n=1 Tax=Winogradskyella aurantia TaxID=1915063 RepID=A0A265UUM4_9FLAO|nr:hypothetical protein [Winogradskyella aurantia]OZV69006.1 hypothetical protein CA834_05970 [Winogradskyella aurantia]
MKNLIRICLVVILLLLLSISLQAQTHFAKLEKNRNIQAKDLVHQLNDTRDTLILKSTRKINYLYTINKSYGREYDLYINSNSYKLPLNKLSKGKHVMVAVQSPKRIVFVVHVYGEDQQTAQGLGLSEKSDITKPVALANVEDDNH